MFLQTNLGSPKWVSFDQIKSTNRCFSVNFFTHCSNTPEQMRGSNVEIVWRRARAARRRSAATQMGVYFHCRVEPDTSKKRSCTPTLARFTVHRCSTSRGCCSQRPRGPCRRDRSPPRSTLGSWRWAIFRFEGLESCKALAMSQPSCFSALRYSAWLAEWPGDLLSNADVGPAREQGVSPHAFLPVFGPVHNRHQRDSRPLGTFWPFCLITSHFLLPSAVSIPAPTHTLPWFFFCDSPVLLRLPFPARNTKSSNSEHKIK